MPGYKCTKCDEDMHSKNPAVRSIFCNDQAATMMTNCTNVMTRRNKKGKRTVTIEFPYCDYDGAPEENDQLEMECVRNIRGLTEDNVKHWLCDHDWEHVSGEVTVR